MQGLLRISSTSFLTLLELHEEACMAMCYWSVLGQLAAVQNLTLGVLLPAVKATSQLHGDFHRTLHFFLTNFDDFELHFQGHCNDGKNKMKIFSCSHPV